MNFNRETIYEQLTDMAEPAYRDFSRRLLPRCPDDAAAFPEGRPFSQDRLLGVRIPKLRRLAKQMVKADAGPAYLDVVLADTGAPIFEEQMLCAMLIGQTPWPEAVLLPRVAAFVPHIDNWSLCDGFAGELKAVSENRERFEVPLAAWLASANPWTKRFGIGLLMRYDCTEAALPRWFAAFDAMSQEHYYVRMGIAWALATAYAAFPKRIDHYLTDNRLAADTRLLTYQKLVESRKVSAEDKARFRARKKAERLALKERQLKNG
jgi:3-methyladenine DNA glycosylase AlkD